MSGDSRPIAPERFALAIKDLPIANLYAKAAELRNSIEHLGNSNEQLKELADAGDRDCADAMAENEEVVQRMEVRIGLLRTEVESRGLRWVELDVQSEGHVNINGQVEEGDGMEVDDLEEEETNQSQDHAAHANRTATTTATRRGRLTDEELRRMLAERLEAQEDDDGVHL